MDFTHISDPLSQEQVPGNDTTRAFLDYALAIFPSHPQGATNAIRQLQNGDPGGFALAAVRLLTATREKSPGLQYLASLVDGDALLTLLSDSALLNLDAAAALARNLAAAEPLLDVRLFRKMLANAGGEIGAVREETALGILKLVDLISDCSRLSSYLIQLLRHPSAEVRSKAALLLGRSNLNLGRVMGFLSSGDSRLRANAIESLWGHGEPAVKTVLREAAKDPGGRVVVNALLGLYRAGDRDVAGRLIELSGSGDPVIRAGAAWGMGETGDAQFHEVLEKLEHDEDPKVRAMAEKSRKRLAPQA